MPGDAEEPERAARLVDGAATSTAAARFRRGSPSNGPTSTTGTDCGEVMGERLRRVHARAQSDTGRPLTGYTSEP